MYFINTSILYNKHVKKKNKNCIISMVGSRKHRHRYGHLTRHGYEHGNTPNS